MYLRCGKELTAVTDCLHNSVSVQDYVSYAMKTGNLSCKWVSNGLAFTHVRVILFADPCRLRITCRTIDILPLSLSRASRRRKKRKKNMMHRRIYRAQTRPREIRRQSAGLNRRIRALLCRSLLLRASFGDVPDFET